MEVHYFNIYYLYIMYAFVHVVHDGPNVSDRLENSEPYFATIGINSFSILFAWQYLWLLLLRWYNSLKAQLTNNTL